MEKISDTKTLEYILDRAFQMIAESPVPANEFVILCRRKFLLHFGSEIRNRFSSYEIRANLTEDVKNAVTWSFQAHGLIFHLVETYSHPSDKEDKTKPVMFAVRGTVVL